MQIGGSYFVILFLLALQASVILTDAPTAKSPLDGKTPDDAHALHNVLQVTDKVISGGIPVGDRAFDELRAMGIRTIISVDGATPDVERARARGMRYVHIPVGYHGIDPDRQSALALAFRDLPGPIYLHCHHGRHRGPAAAASGAIMAGMMTPEEGTALLKKAGTSPDYKGLYACVANSKAVSAEELSRVPADFPEIAPMPGYVRAMSEVQAAYDHLVEIRDAGWTAPENHPDLVPLDEIRNLERLMKVLLDDPKTKEMPKDHGEMMRTGADAAAALLAAMERNAPKSELNSLLRSLGASCKDCHVRYRDNRP